VHLQPDVPFQANHCGSCTACLQACPTAAFVAPGQLDARRCISYLTIELKTSIPADLRSDMGNWLFGCDICQEVCPWNRKAPPGQEPELLSRPELAEVDLVELLSLSEADFRQRFRGTPLMRPKRRGLLRNAAIVLGNIGTAEALPALEQAARDAEPLIREAARWASARIQQRQMEKSSARSQEMEAVQVTISYTEEQSPEHNPPD
jgi:epoxyqueuosine reductase